MLLLLSESWLLIGLRGLVFLVFGVAVALSSAESYPALAEWIGLLALADGAIHAVLGARFRRLVDAWWLEALRAAVTLFLGAGVFLAPTLVAANLFGWLVTGTLLATLLEIAVGLGVRNPLGPERVFLLTGGGSVLIGVLLFGSPWWPVALSVVGLVRGASILLGLVQAGLAWRLRTLTLQSRESRTFLLRLLQERRLAASR
jgi:uncharacterized membrane protein HdeD (DUF308 family)